MQMCLMLLQSTAVSSVNLSSKCVLMGTQVFVLQKLVKSLPLDLNQEENMGSDSHSFELKVSIFTPDRKIL